MRSWCSHRIRRRAGGARQSRTPGRGRVPGRAATAVAGGCTSTVRSRGRGVGSTPGDQGRAGGDPCRAAAGAARSPGLRSPRGPVAPGRGRPGHPGGGTGRAGHRLPRGVRRTARSRGGRPPRPDFKSGILAAFTEGVKDRPGTTFGNVKADVLAHYVPGFVRGDFVEVIKDSAWPEQPTAPRPTRPGPAPQARRQRRRPTRRRAAEQDSFRIAGRQFLRPSRGPAGTAPGLEGGPGNATPAAGMEPSWGPEPGVGAQAVTGPAGVR